MYVISLFIVHIKVYQFVRFFLLSFSSIVLWHGNDINHRYSTFISVFSSVARHLTWNIECQINVYSMRVTFQSCSTTIAQFKCHRQQKLLVWNRIAIQPTSQLANESTEQCVQSLQIMSRLIFVSMLLQPNSSNGNGGNRMTEVPK